MIRCPFCAEAIRGEALVCKHCGSRVLPQPSESLNIRTNGLAVTSMICALLWVWWLGSLVGLVFGYVAKHQIARSGGSEVGGGMATAGIVLGWLGMAVLFGFAAIAII